MKTISLAMGNYVKIKGKKYHFPYLDYDIKNIKEVERDAKYLQEKFRLGDAVITKTKNGFHSSFFWDSKFSFKKIKEIRKASKLADKDFIDLNTNRSRISGKDLRFFKMVRSEFHKPNEIGNFLKNNYMGMINGLKNIYL